MTRRFLFAVLAAALPACSGPDGGDRGGAPALMPARAAEAPTVPAGDAPRSDRAPTSRLPTAGRERIDQERPNAGRVVGPSGGQGMRSRLSRQDR